jgi:hydroxypyruvate isomerase
MTGYRLSPNIELLFTDAGDDAAARVRAAAAAGFDAVEMWSTFDKDVGALADALNETGVSLTSVLAEPRTNFTLPGTDLGPYFDGLERGIENARALGCPRIVLGSGIGFPGAKRAANLAKLIEAFSTSVERFGDSGVTMVLEPVNTRVDHPGALLDRTDDAVHVIREVGSPSLRLLYDLYHSVTEGEDPATVLAAASDVIDYVQIADSPGRGEPGTGGIDWSASLGLLASAGYAGPIGLELMPTTSTVEALDYIRKIAATVPTPSERAE